MPLKNWNLFFTISLEIIHARPLRLKNCTFCRSQNLLFTGFFIQAVGEKDCVEFKKISDGIERIQKPNSKTRLAADCLSFLKLQELSKHYYRYVLEIPQITHKFSMLTITSSSYRGSLTTPPYFTSVQWIVYRTPYYVSEKQIATFRSLRSQDEAKCIVNNYRDIQQPVSVPKVIFTRNVLKSKL